jgi:hypothetical protein
VDVLPGSPLSGHLPFCCLLLVAAIVLVSCCVSSITVGSVGTVLALMAFGHGPLTGISSLILVLFLLKKSTPAVVPVIPVLFLLSVLVVDRSVGTPPLTSINFCCCGDSLL